jgi:hypothetical protein
MGELSQAFHALLDEMRDLERRTLDSPNMLPDEQSRAEVYKWIFSITQVAFDCFVWGDPEKPRWVDIVGPYKKWGGDNADAFYQFVPVDPRRTYRVSGRKGNAVYMSLTVYGGPNDGHYSERIVGSANDKTMSFDDDGEFVLWMGPTRPEAAAPHEPWIELAPDAVVAITRDYLADPNNERRIEWRIECIDGATVWRETEADLAARFTKALTWLKDQSAITPIPLGTPNHIDPPYPVPAVTFGWAAGDAAYAMGSFQLADGEALVLRGRSPECAFWNICLWNTLLHTYNSAYDRVTINGFQVEYEPDGSWEVVVAAEDPGHPNWISTQGHDAGRIWFRWFYPSETPAEVEATVVPLAQAGR